MRVMVAAALLLMACGETTTVAETPRAAIAAGSETDTGGWEAHLTEMLPFIDACIARSPDTRTISFAAPTGEALVTVRLSGPNGDIDCTVPGDDPTPTNVVIAPRRAEWQPSGEGAFFVRGPGDNPGGECYEAPEARAPDGELIGWWLDPEGC